LALKDSNQVGINKKAALHEAAFPFIE